MEDRGDLALGNRVAKLGNAAAHLEAALGTFLTGLNSGTLTAQAATFKTAVDGLPAPATTKAMGT